MMRAPAVVALMCLPAIALAQTSRSDFARGADIYTGTGSIFQVALPDDVYETVTRQDLGDIRVLNASGHPVPHALRQIPAPASEDAEWHEVRFFPMTSAVGAAPARTQVRLDASGTVLEVTGGAADARTTAYLVDASSVEQPFTRIALSWHSAPNATFLARVTIERSDDLNAWSTVVASAAMAQLQRDGQTLTQNEIQLPSAQRAKYLRVLWPQELDKVMLTAVRVLPRPKGRTADIRWKTLAANRMDALGTAFYDTQATFPVQYVDLDFAYPTDVASVTIYSRPAPTTNWIVRHAGVFYALPGDAGAAHSSSARVGGTFDRYWRVETAREGGWTQTGAPRLRLGWHPHEIVFLAQGPAPFTLVYGSGRVAAADAPVDTLLASLSESDLEQRVRPATLGPPHTLSGADVLAPPTPLRRFVLWGVLIAAVGALAFYAVRVFRDTESLG